MIKSKLLLCLTLGVFSCANAQSTAIEKIIHKYHMQPLPNEGGYFNQTYYLCDSKSCKKTKHADSTAILYLITNKVVSKFHRVPSDEMFHFYTGSPVMLVQLEKNGTVLKTVLGNDVLHGQHVQVTVPKNTWQGAYLIGSGEYALMGTTMTPGYYGEEIAKRSDLIKQYPKEKNTIFKLTK